MVPADKRPIQSLYIARAVIRPYRYAKVFRISVDVKGLANGIDQELTMAALAKLPEPIFVHWV